MYNQYLNKQQLKAELEKCLQCPTKPCMKACPVQCSPKDFIAAAKQNEWNKAAKLIYEQNPLGEVCGLICPDKFCMRACLRANIDYPIRIPKVQASIMRKARENTLSFSNTQPENKFSIAVIGLGPAGIGAIAELVQHGFKVTAFEKDDKVGGALNLIPQNRLPLEIIQYEWNILAQNPAVKVNFNTYINNYASLLTQGFSAVIIAGGEQKSRKLNITGEKYAVDYTQYLQNPLKYKTSGNVGIIGGGAAAVDCAITVAKQGANKVEMFVRRRICDMRIEVPEMKLLLDNHVDITAMTRPTSFKKEQDGHLTVYTVKTYFSAEGKLADIPNSRIPRKGFDLIILALGSSRAEEIVTTNNIWYAGDMINGGSTAVEALASGKKAAQEIVQKFKIHS